MGQWVPMGQRRTEYQTSTLTCMPSAVRCVRASFSAGERLREPPAEPCGEGAAGSGAVSWFGKDPRRHPFGVCLWQAAPPNGWGFRFDVPRAS